tara:strand:- start:380 stop:937 length:558 start_codon:yes stop_codon:yes gene_type:complete
MGKRTEPKEVSLEVRFWSRVEPFNTRDSKACALWIGHCLPAGYGTLHDADGNPRYAHRVSWELHNKKPIPEGKVVHHTCENPQCVRPSHLELTTYQGNRKAAVDAGRNEVLPRLQTVDVLAIRYMYATHRWSQGDLAILFFGINGGVGQPIIQKIVTGQTYTSVGGPISTRGRGRAPARRAGPCA